MGGIDVLERAASKTGADVVSATALPFWGLALGPDRARGSWRQISTTSKNAGDAPRRAYSAFAARALAIRAEMVLPLVCCEMFNERVHAEAAKLAPGVVVVSGHEKLGQGLVERSTNSIAASAARSCKSAAG